jgi:DNA gyrase subunit A
LPLVNLLEAMNEKEHATAVIALKSLQEKYILIMATKNGLIKKTHLEEFQNIRPKGLIAVNLRKGDELISVRLAREEDEIIMVTERGQSIRFPASDVTTHHRQSGGVRGMRLAQGDTVIAMDIILPDSFLFAVTKTGFGKLTRVGAYRRQGRGGSGVKTFKVTPKTGKVVQAHVVSPEQQIMLISEKGVVNRTTLEEVRITGRIAQGVHVMKLDPGDTLSALACFDIGDTAGEPPVDENPKPGRGRRAAKPEEEADEPKAKPKATHGDDGKRPRGKK